MICGRCEVELTVEIRPWVFLRIDGFCCVVREGNVNYIILCDRHEVEFTAEIMTIICVCLAIFVVVLGGDVLCSKTACLCSAPG